MSSSVPPVPSTPSDRRAVPPVVMPEAEARAIVDVAGEFTSQTSTAVRQLALAGIAVPNHFQGGLGRRLLRIIRTSSRMCCRKRRKGQKEVR
jgi:hypothetical protein